MRTLDVESRDPFYNLALEEYLLKEYPADEDLLFFWRSTPSLIVGRNQNPYNEIQLANAYELGIPVLRRISGGGTVYHDLGNLNFTFIMRNPKERIRNYRFFLEPIVEVLRNTGLDVRFVAPSHLYLGANKISGNAQSFHKQKMIHHGTLLFDTNLTRMTTLLKQSPRVSTNTVDSTRATTTNLRPSLSVSADITSFAEYLRSELMFGQEQDQIVLTSKDQERIHTLVETKYRSLDWTVGQTPSFDLDVLLDGTMQHLRIDRGRIASSTWLQNRLMGLFFLPETLKPMLADLPHIDSILRVLFDGENA